MSNTAFRSKPPTVQLRKRRPVQSICRNPYGCTVGADPWNAWSHSDRDTCLACTRTVGGPSRLVGFVEFSMRPKECPMCLWLFGKRETSHSRKEIVRVNNIYELLEFGEFDRDPIALSHQNCWMCGFNPHLVKQALHAHGSTQPPDAARKRLEHVFAIAQMAVASNPLRNLADTLREVEGRSEPDYSELRNVLKETDRLIGPGTSIYSSRVLRDRIGEATTLMRNLTPR